MPRWPAVQHVSFPVRDPRRSAAFYRDLLGFQELATTDRIAELIVGETKFVLLRATDFVVPTEAHFGFQETSRTAVDEWGRRIRRSGAVIDFGPGVADWGGYTIYFRDPDGYRIEIWTNR